MIVEDGTIVAGANSYVTLAEARAFAADRGATLSADDAVLSGILVAATDYLESFRGQYIGLLVSPLVQPLQWPRKKVVLYGADFPENIIPQVLKNAQCQLAVEKTLGTDPLKARSEPFVIKEEVGALKTTYSDDVGTNTIPTMPSVDNWLSILLLSGGHYLRTLRI